MKVNGLLQPATGTGLNESDLACWLKRARKGAKATRQSKSNG